MAASPGSDAAAACLLPVCLLSAAADVAATTSALDCVTGLRRSSLEGDPAAATPAFVLRTAPRDSKSPHDRRVFVTSRSGLLSPPLLLLSLPLRPLLLLLPALS